MPLKTIMQQLKKNWPEYYLILATLYYWFLTSTLFNPVALLLLGLLAFQLLFQKSIPGALISSVVILVNIYLIFALLSELSETTPQQSAFWQILVFGCLFLGLNLFAGFSMFRKNLA